MPNIKILPESGRPQITPEALEKLLGPYQDQLKDFKLTIVGIRGFFSSFGPTNRNDRNVYDDAIILRAPSLGTFIPFNGNTDPTRIHKGYGTSEKTKGVAVLNTGLWPVYRFDKHNGSHPHEAICQRNGQVTVTRDGNPPYRDTGNFCINIHRGGYTVTSSLGCQTIPPEQWDEFYEKASGAAKKLWGDSWKKETIAYVLLEHQV